MEGFESWSKQWWFPEQTWSFHAAVSVNLTFGRRDLELISSIISDLEIVRPSPSQREDTLAKMKTHFSSSSSRRSSVVTRRSFLGRDRVIQSYDDNFEDWEGLHQALSTTSQDRFEVRGFQAQLNAVADHYLASMPKGQKAIVPARFRLKPNIYRCSDGGWCLVDGMSKPHEEPCETCKFRKGPRVKKDLFRSAIYPWESDEEDSPYFYYCPRGRAGIQAKSYSTYSNQDHRFRGKYPSLASLFPRPRPRRKKRKMSKKRYLKRQINVRTRIRTTVKLFKYGRHKKMWKRSMQRIKLFQAKDEIANDGEVAPSKLEGLFSKVVDLRASRDVAKRAAASLLEANKKQLSQLRPPPVAAASKQPIVKQVSEEGLLPLGDPYDDMYYHGGRGGGVKWNKTLVQSMTIGMGGSTSAANITYTDQGLKVIDYNDVGPTTKSQTEKDFLYGKSVDRKKRKQVLYPDKKDSDIARDLMSACVQEQNESAAQNESNLKKFVKSFKKMRKKGLIGDMVDADTLLRGLLHPSDYRKILRHVVEEPKVTVGEFVACDLEEPEQMSTRHMARRKSVVASSKPLGKALVKSDDEV